MKGVAILNPQTLLSAAKATMIPESWSGLWFTKKLTTDKPLPSEYKNRKVTIPPGTYTYLYRVTDSTLHKDPPGEVVMEDTHLELQTHLDFMLRARGNVLITGLGLGCVIRGLLANPNVNHVTCVENSKDVLKLVAPCMPRSRLTIVEADAREWTADNKYKFDCAWHDLWTNRDAGEPLLDIWHTQLIINCLDNVSRQGAWNTPRLMKRMLRERGIELIG